MDLSATRKQISTLVVKRNKLEYELLEFRHKITKGSLFTRYFACKKGNCKCTKGMLHGPFWCMTTKDKGKSVYKYLGRNENNAIVKALKRYKEFQAKSKKIDKLNNEIANLWKKFRNGLLKLGKKK